MRAITFQSVTAYLLDDAPSDDLGELLATVPTFSETGLTKRETRKPVGDTLRLTLKWSTYLPDRAAVTALRNSLQALNTQRVLCPLWPAAFAAGVTSPTVTADYYVLMGDGSAPEIKTHAQLPFARQAYPMLVGMLEQRPDPALLTDTVADVSFGFVENDIWYVTVPAYSPPSGLSAAGSTRPLFPWRPNWATPPKGATADVDVTRQAVGKSRATSDAYYTQPSRRGNGQTFTLQTLEPWQLLRLLLDLTHKSFWLPAGMSDLTLAADVLSAATTITANGTLGTTSTVLLDDLTNRVPLSLGAPTGSVYPTTPSPVGTAFTASQTRVESLVLSRFENGSISMRWHTTGTATATIAFAEVPWETAVTSGETLGTTMGALPACCYLYSFNIDLPGGALNWAFTDFEHDLTADLVFLHTKAPIQHGTIRERLGLDRQTVEITSRYFADNPLAMLIPFRLEWPLTVTISEADVNGVTALNVRKMFVGEIDSARFDGPFIRAAAASLGSIFDRRLPRRLLQPTDNWALFETDNELVAADWEWTGTVGSYNATTGELALTSVARVSGSPVTLVAGFFAGGYMRFGSGSSAQYRMVADSTAAVAGALSLFIAAPFTTNPVASNAAWFYPGYDGRGETARDRFANFDNFGGFPHMPIGNPTVLKPSKDASSGAKK